MKWPRSLWLWGFGVPCFVKKLQKWVFSDYAEYAEYLKVREACCLWNISSGTNAKMSCKVNLSEKIWSRTQLPSRFGMCTYLLEQETFSAGQSGASRTHPRMWSKETWQPSSTFSSLPCAVCASWWCELSAMLRLQWSITCVRGLQILPAGKPGGDHSESHLVCK